MAQEATASSKIASLILRIVAFLFLLTSLIVLSTNNVGELRFRDVYAYRYMLSAIVIGTAYSLLQLAFSIFNVVSGGDGIPLLDFFGDKLISYLLATGAAAGFGVSVDLKKAADASGQDLLSFDDKAFASCSLLLFAFVATAVLSIISAFTLPKRV